MHTYFKSNNKDEYEVGYYIMERYANPNSGDDFVESNWIKIRSFKNEIHAVTFINFLNGGKQDVTLIKDLLDQK